MKNVRYVYHSIIELDWGGSPEEKKIIVWLHKGPVSVSCKQNPVWFGHWALFVDNHQFLPNKLGL